MIIKGDAYQRRIFIDGNSLMMSGATVGNGQYMLTALSGMLTSHGPIFGTAVGNTTIAQLTSTFITRIGSQSRPNDIVICMGITNDARTGVSPAQIKADYITYTNLAHSYGLKVIICTCPAGKLSGDPANTVTQQLAANALIRADYAPADLFVDFGSISQLNTEAGITNTTYYVSDQLHLTDVGYQLMANLAAPVIQTLL